MTQFCMAYHDFIMSISNHRKENISTHKKYDISQIIKLNQADQHVFDKKTDPLLSEKETNLLQKNVVYLNSFVPFNFNKFRKITSRRQRQNILKKYSFLRDLFMCKSKSKMHQIFMSIPTEWKEFLTFYFTKCLTKHLLIRQIKDYRILLRYRQTLFEAIENPDLIKDSLPFTSNLVKNFCKGVCNFVVMFYRDLAKNSLIPRSDTSKRFDQEGKYIKTEYGSSNLVNQNRR